MNSLVRTVGLLVLTTSAVGCASSNWSMSSTPTRCAGDQASGAADGAGRPSVVLFCLQNP